MCKTKKTNKIVLIGILVSQALILSIVEKAIPMPIPIPGIKLGLANIISLFAIITLGFKDAVIIVILRVILASIFAGGVTGFLYSIAGGLISTVVMSFIYKKFRACFSIVSISVIGAVCHNISQLSVASFVIDDMRIFYYLPPLIIAGVITGILIGFTSKYTIEPVKKILKLTDV